MFGTIMWLNRVMLGTVELLAVLALDGKPVFLLAGSIWAVFSYMMVVHFKTFLYLYIVNQFSDININLFWLILTHHELNIFYPPEKMICSSKLWNFKSAIFPFMLLVLLIEVRIYISLSPLWSWSLLPFLNWCGSGFPIIDSVFLNAWCFNKVYPPYDGAF